MNLQKDWGGVKVYTSIDGLFKYVSNGCEDM